VAVAGKKELDMPLKRKSIVYFVSARATVWDYAHSLPAKLTMLLEKVDWSRFLKKDDYVAVKIHFGSAGAYQPLRPVFVRKVVEVVSKAGGKPFVTDATRIKGWDYLDIAASHGFTPQTCGAPVILADGLFGRDCVYVQQPEGEVITEIGVASAIYWAPAMMVMSHCKGHISTGLAAAIKNVGMGGLSVSDSAGVSQRGKIHTMENLPPQWDEALCLMDDQCVDVCPQEAIWFENDIWSVNLELCTRCGRCTRVCPSGALTMPVGEERFSLALVEAAKAVLSTFKPGRIWYLNFVLDVQPECDCMPMADTAVIQDQGILLSDDPVAIDQAALDIINQASPLPQSKAEDKGITEPGDILAKITGRNPQLIIDDAERLGLGNKDYRLITLEPKARPQKPFHTSP